MAREQIMSWAKIFTVTLIIIFTKESV